MVELLGEKQRQLRSRHSDTAAVGELQPSALIASVCVTANCLQTSVNVSISGLVVEYIVAIDVTRVRFPAAALRYLYACCMRTRRGSACDDHREAELRSG